MKLWKKGLCLLLAGLLVSQSLTVEGTDFARAAKTDKAVIKDDEGDFDEGDYCYDEGDLDDDMYTELYFTEEEITVGEFTYTKLKDYVYISGCSGISWESSDDSVASVSREGVLYAKKAGTVVISVSDDVDKEDSFIVNIQEATISITKSKTLKVGKSTTLSITPSRYRTHVKWTSGNKKVATVDKNGKVTAQSAGTCTITAAYGNQKKTCKITVPKVKLKLNAKKITVNHMKTKQLKVSTNLDKKLIKWKTSNSKVARVSGTGKVVPTGAGTCKITAYCKKYKTSCTIKVPSYKVKPVKGITLKRGNNIKKYDVTGDGKKDSIWITCGNWTDYKEKIGYGWSIYINGTLEYYTNNAEYLDVKYYKVSAGKQYLAIKEYICDNGELHNAGLYQYKKGTLTKVCDLYDSILKYVSSWCYGIDIKSLSAKKMVVQCCTQLNATGYIGWTMTYKYKAGKWKLSGKTFSVSKKPKWIYKKSWTVNRKFTVKSSPGGKKNAFTVNKGEKVKIKRICFKNNRAYLQITRANGKTGWLIEPKRFIADRYYFKEATFVC